MSMCVLHGNPYYMDSANRLKEKRKLLRHQVLAGYTPAHTLYIHHYTHTYKCAHSHYIVTIFIVPMLVFR